MWRNTIKTRARIASVSISRTYYDKMNDRDIERTIKENLGRWEIN
jgi:hypothetical protein